MGYWNITVNPLTRTPNCASSRSSLLAMPMSNFFQKVKPSHQESEEGHQKVLLVQGRYVSDVVVGLEDAAHSPGVGYPELELPVHAHRNRRVIESAIL